VLFLSQSYTHLKESENVIGIKKKKGNPGNVITILLTIFPLSTLGIHSLIILRRAMLNLVQVKLYYILTPLNRGHLEKLIVDKLVINSVQSFGKEILLPCSKYSPPTLS
jgi:hypothetical protein